MTEGGKESGSELPGLATLMDRYDGFLIDLWGVLHDGAKILPGAFHCLEEMRQRKKPVVILSNAPRRAKEVAAYSARLGVSQDLYTALFSSGELTWELLKDRPDEIYRQLGRRVYCMMAGRDMGLLTGLDLEPVQKIEEAEFLLATGFEGDEGISPYRPLLENAAKRKLRMICANPDLAVVYDGMTILCAGTLARYYEGLGGTVLYHGKPHPLIYRSAMACLEAEGAKSILAIGDGLHTDIAGARAVNLDSLWIACGLHAPVVCKASGQMDWEQAIRFCTQEGIHPKWVLPHLFWEKPVRGGGL